MWVRDESRPTPYKGRTYDSATEAKVAEQLDVLGVTWHPQLDPRKAFLWSARSYEPAPPDVTAWYVPDFAIEDAAEHLELPLWVEVKPADMLSALRDHLDVHDSDLTAGDVERRIDAAHLWQANFRELYKPKRLAELYDRDVLVVYQINRNRSLSVLMRPTGVVLSKRHPAVNHRQVVANEEKARRDALQRAEQEARRIERERERVAREVERAAEAERRRAEREERVAELVEQMRRNHRPALYGAPCLACGQLQSAEALVIAHIDGFWRKLCRSHLEENQ